MSQTGANNPHVITLGVRVNPALVITGFDGLPEAGTIARFALEFGAGRPVSREVALAMISSREARLLVVPSVDEQGLSTQWFIDDCLQRAPDLEVLALVPSRAPAASGIDQLIARGVNVGSVRTASELAALIQQTLKHTQQNGDRSTELAAALAGFHPPPLRKLLQIAVSAPATRVTREGLATTAGVSVRTLERWLESAQWPPLAELVSWVALFRASAMIERAHESTSRLALAAGFSGGRALRRASSQLLQMRPFDRDRLSVGRVAIHFHQRLGGVRARKP